MIGFSFCLYYYYFNITLNKSLQVSLAVNEIQQFSNFDNLENTPRQKFSEIFTHKEGTILQVFQEQPLKYSYSRMRGCISTLDVLWENILRVTF